MINSYQQPEEGRSPYTRPIIREVSDIADVVDPAEEALLLCPDVEIYQRAHALVRVLGAA